MKGFIATQHSGRESAYYFLPLSTGTLPARCCKLWCFLNCRLLIPPDARQVCAPTFRFWQFGGTELSAPRWAAALRYRRYITQLVEAYMDGNFLLQSPQFRQFFYYRQVRLRIAT